MLESKTVISITDLSPGKGVRHVGPRQMAQLIKVPVARPGQLNWTPRTHKDSYKFSDLHKEAIAHAFLHKHMHVSMHIYIKIKM